MPRAARALRAALPAVHIALQGEQLSSPLAKALHDGVLDVAVLRPCAELDGLVTKTLLTEPIVVAVPDGHRLAGQDEVDLADLANEVFVSYPMEVSAVAKTQRDACLAAAGREPGAHSRGSLPPVATCDHGAAAPRPS